MLKWYTMQMFPGKFSLTTCPKDLAIHCKKARILVPDYTDTYGFALQVGGNGLVFINPNPVKDVEGDALDTIIHESVHIWQALCEYMQEEKAGDEVEAYGIAFIASTLIKEYQRQISSKEQAQKDLLCPS